MDFDFNIRRRSAKLVPVPVMQEVEEADAGDTGYGRQQPADDFDGQFSRPRRSTVSSSSKYGPDLEPYMDDIDEVDDKRTAKLPAKPKADDIETIEDTGEEPAKSSSAGDGVSNPNGPKDPKNPDDRWYKRWIAFVKQHPQASIAVGAVVIIAIAGGVAYALTRPNKADNSQLTTKKYVKPQPKPAPITSPMTGLVVSADDAKRPTTSVMIENTTFARPQSGLKEAGVVYEAIAEAGITRFLALYQEGKPGNIGPVRSSRPYYVDWAHSFDAGYAHVGGSPDALAKIKTDGVRDLDQFFNAGYYHRVSSREAPHNVYTDIGQLDAAKTAKGWTSSTFTSWPRKADAPAPSRTGASVTARTVNIAISGPTYNTHYDYVPETNSYNRSEGGAPHIDAESKTQLSPKVVIALVIPYKLEADAYHSNYALDGTGNMTVFQDGVATKGTWKRGTGNSQYEFSDEAGHPLKLDAGQTWITAVSDPAAITYAP